MDGRCYKGHSGCSGRNYSTLWWRQSFGLVDCLYVSSVRRNLILVPSLACNGYSVFFNKNNIFIKKDDETICVGALIDNLYLLNVISLMQQINSNESNLKKKFLP